MNNQSNDLFCTRQFKPAVVLIVIMCIAAIGWTVHKNGHWGYGRHGFGGEGRYRGMGPASGFPILQVATAPPISANAKPPHGSWGACANCHTVTGTKAGAGAKTAGAVMMVAGAPPIRFGAPPPHPAWGMCNNCHQITNNDVRPAAPAPAAATMGVSSVAPPLGIWLRPLTPATADKLGLENTDGVLITAVEYHSPAYKAGLREGDVIVRIDNKKVETLNEALAIIAMKNVQDTVKLNVLRNNRERKVFITISQTPGAAVVPMGIAAAAPASAVNARWIAVAAATPSFEAQVAPAFGAAPSFVLFDPVSGQFSVLDNPAAGTLGSSQQAAALLVNAGVKAVIVGNIGPASLNRLNAAGIQVYTGAFGSVRDAVERYLEGRLVAAAAATAPGFNPGAPANRELVARIAVASLGRTLDAPVADDLGVAPYLVIYDTRDGNLEVVGKQPAPDQGINSVQTAQLLVDHGASGVIAGNISPASVKTLSSLGVFTFAGVSGTVGSAIQMYRNGQLSAAADPGAVPPPHAANPEAA